MAVIILVQGSSKVEPRSTALLKQGQPFSLHPIILYFLFISVDMSLSEEKSGLQKDENEAV